MRFLVAAALGALLSTGTLPAAAPRPATAPGRVEMTDAGPVVLSKDGRSLYVSERDAGRPGQSLCTDVAQRQQLDMANGFGMLDLPRSDKVKSCAEKYPPFLAAAGDAAAGHWGIIDRPEGTRQWTYRGRPLYFSDRDRAPGDRFGVVMTFQLAMDVESLGLPPGITLGLYGEDLVLTTGQKLIFARTGKGACRKGCDDRFSALLAPELARPQGDWSVITASGQPRQYAFKGRPLFVSAEDRPVRDIEALGGWQTVRYRKGEGTPREIGRQLSLAGELYTTREGRTLYVYRCRTLLAGGVSCDGAGEPARHLAALCSNGPTCSARWQPYRADARARRSGDWSVVEITDPPFLDPSGELYPADAPKVKVWAYRGSPVYTYHLDTGPREIRGYRVRTPGDRKYMTPIHVPGRSLEGGDFQLR